MKNQLKSNPWYCIHPPMAWVIPMDMSCSCAPSVARDKLGLRTGADQDLGHGATLKFHSDMGETSWRISPRKQNTSDGLLTRKEMVLTCFDTFLTKKSGENHHFKQETWEEGWSPTRKNGKISQHKDINFMRIEMIHPLNTRWIPAWGRAPPFGGKDWLISTCSNMFPLKDGPCHGPWLPSKNCQSLCDQRLWVAQMATETQ